MISNPEKLKDTEERVKEDHLSECVSIFLNRPLSEQSTVFEGRFTHEKGDSIPCAVKIPRYQTQYERERTSLKKIGCNQNVISLIYSGCCEDNILSHYYLVLEKCHNLNLEQYLIDQRNTIPTYELDWRIGICKQILNGMAAIHDKLIVHKDVKPSNILLTPNLEDIKIADFGSSEKVPSFASAVYCPDAFGTIGYRSPESFGRCYVSLRTDIFSLGATLYFILSDGRSPFGDEDDLWDHNVRHGIRNLSSLKVPNMKTTAHLIDSMLSAKRGNRPSIWEVFGHPCWKKIEIDFDLEYKCDERIEPQPHKVDHIGEDVDFADPSELITALFKVLDLKVEQSEQTAPIEANAQTSLVICDGYGSNLNLLSPKNPDLSYIYDYNDEMKTNLFSTVGMGTYVYVLTYKKSFYRLKCDDASVGWERMPDMIEYHGQYPPAVANGSAIFVAGKSGHKPSRSTSKFESTSKTWTMLEDKTLSSCNSANVCIGNFVYSIGGAIDEAQTATIVVERMDIASGSWERVNGMITARHQAAASAYRKNIFIVGGRDNEQEFNTAEQYDQERDQWTMMKSMAKPRWGPRFRCHVIGDVLYAVGGDGRQFGESIEKYDHRKQQWIKVKLNHPEIEIWSSASVTSHNHTI